MAGTSTRRGRRQKTETLALAAQGFWSTPFKLDELGWSGLIARLVIRGPVTSTVTEVDVRIYYGAGYDTATDPAAVPDEDIAYERTGIVVAGSATVADLDYDVLQNHGGALYDIRDNDDDLWISIKSVVASAADADCTLSVEARESL